MKTRTGFVSNSSSSSFIIPVGGRFPSVADLAIYMIRHRGWDNDQADIDRIRRHLALGMSADHPIAFQSCNFDTFIVREQNMFFVATCHNHDFEFEEGGMAQDDDMEHHILYEMPYDTKYYNATWNLTGWKYGQQDRDGWHCKEWCKECVVDLWVTEAGFPFCPKCGKRPEEVDPFEVWWRTHPISKSNLQRAMINGFREVAKAAWDAGVKHGTEEG